MLRSKIYILLLIEKNLKIFFIQYPGVLHIYEHAKRNIYIHAPGYKLSELENLKLATWCSITFEIIDGLHEEMQMLVSIKELSAIHMKGLEVMCIRVERALR